MQSLITQFEALKQQFMAFGFALNNTIPPSAPDPNNINVLHYARERAQADVQARTDARVEELRSLFVDNRTEVKRLLNSQYNGPWKSSAKQQLALIEQNIARIEAERKQKRKPLSKFAQACAQVRASDPTLSKGDVYLQARMRLKVKECGPGLAALNH